MVGRPSLYFSFRHCGCHSHSLRLVMSIQQLFRIDNNPFLSHRWVINISATFKSNLSILFVHLSGAGVSEELYNRFYHRNRITFVRRHRTIRLEEAPTSDEELSCNLFPEIDIVSQGSTGTRSIPFGKLTNSHQRARLH